MRATEARVKFPNTPDSDKQFRVLHVVTLDDGSTVEIWATDPLDAIEEVNANIQAGVYATRTQRQ